MKFPEQIKKTRGSLGFIADVISVFSTNWGLVLSFIIATGAGFWKYTYDFLSDPRVQITGNVFLWLFWTYIGVSILRRLSAGIKTIPVPDFERGVAIEQWQPVYDHNSEDAAFQLGVTVRNVTNLPMRIIVDEFRVIIDNRTLPDSPPVESVIARFGVKGVVTPAFKKSAIQGNMKGQAIIRIRYGRTSGPLEREFKHRANFNIRAPAPGSSEVLGFASSIEFEDDSNI